MALKMNISNFPKFRKWFVDQTDHFFRFKKWQHCTSIQEKNATKLLIVSAISSSDH